MNKRLLQTVRKNDLAKKIVSQLEKASGGKLEFNSTTEMSFYDNLEFAIYIGKKRGISEDWKCRILFHELGHAFFDIYRKKIDKSAYRRLFKGSINARYYDGTAKNFLKTKGHKRDSVSLYGKTHPEEAFAEAFSFVLANVDDSEESAEVIQQLAFVEWCIDNCLQGKRNWGKFTGYATTIECCECSCKFDLDSRKDGEVEGWEIDCPECNEVIAA